MGGVSLFAAVVASLTAASGCRGSSARTPRDGGDDQRGAACLLVEEGYGPPGSVEVRVEIVARGLEVPWALAFLPNGDILVTERPGRVRLVRDGQLAEQPVAQIEVAAAGEGGLLGLALHPNFAATRSFYVYYTADAPNGAVNRVERWVLSQDGRSAMADRVILEGIPAAAVHDGGRLRFGPDGMLYIGTGDAREASLAQDVGSLAGKILRVTPEGTVPDGNPWQGNPAFVAGVRNSQGFDWRDDGSLVIVDHGPSGEQGRRGHDEISVASAGANLGWPLVVGCEARAGLVAPAITWTEAVPPAGAAFYTGDAIPQWRGDLIVGTLGSRHLHRVSFAAEDAARVDLHDVYLLGDEPEGFGRLRSVDMGRDGALYVTTSNCDGRGSCPEDGDKILRLTR